MLKLVIIDDEKWTRNVIKSFGKWSELGIEIVGEAEDGETGLSLIRDKHPDIIITDMQMPNMDGVELLKVIKAENYRARIIVISGFDDYKYMKQAIQSKAFEYILKPIDSKEFNRILSQCVSELYIDGDVSSSSLQDILGRDLFEKFIKEIKTFRISFQEKNSDKSIESILNIKKLMPINDNEHECIKVSLINEFIWPILREDLRSLIYDNKSLLEEYENIRKLIKQGIEYKVYFNRIRQLIEKSINYYKESLKQSKKPIVDLAYGYIEENFRKDISLNSVAGSLFTSKEYLSNVYKSKYKMTVGQHILKLKMEEAIKLLSNGLSHKEISDLIGYHDVTYFYKVFKKYYGYTPGEYLDVMKD